MRDGRHAESYRGLEILSRLKIHNHFNMFFIFLSKDGFINIDLQLPVSQGVDLAEHNISSASQGLLLQVLLELLSF